MSSNLVGCTIFELKRGREVKFAISFFCVKKGLIDGPCHRSHLFHARNFGELIDFQLEVFTIPKAIRLFDQPADFIIEAFHFSIADMPKSPETDNSVKFIPDCSSHAFSFRNAGLFCEFDPAMECDISMIGSFCTHVNHFQRFFEHISIPQFLKISPHIV